MQYVYKVVAAATHEPDVFYSAALAPNAPYRLEYTIGKKTVADRRTQGIFVFKSVKSAKHFVEFDLGWVAPYSVLRCNFTGVLRRPRYFVNPSLLCYAPIQPVKELAKFAELKGYAVRFNFDQFPWGTYVVKSVTPTKLLDTYHQAAKAWDSDLQAALKMTEVS